MPVNRDLIARLLQPIREDAPAGADLRYDARVDVIKEARREELDLPTNNAEHKRKVADWPQVVQLTATLLVDETKDLQLAAWLVEALLRRDGYAGLATGLTALHELLETFWATIHPQPEDGDHELRIGPLEWVGTKLPIPLRMVPFGAAPYSFLQLDQARALPTELDAEQSADAREARAAATADGKITPEAAAEALARLDKTALRTLHGDLDAARAALVALDRVADARFGDGAPSLVGLRNTIDEIMRFAGALLARRLEEDPDPIGEEPVASDVSSTVTTGETLSTEPTSVADAMQRIQVIARWLRAQDAAHPAPYLLVRGVRWGELRATAPTVDPRLLEAPPTALRARLKTLLLDGKWSELLEQSEQLMASSAGRGWLDLQRYVLTACAQLGGHYDAVAAAIRSELRVLLSALPELPRMTMMDDTPTANEETRAWLIEEARQSAADATDSGAATPGAATDDPATADLVVDEGMAVLQDAADEDATAAQQGGFSRARALRRPTARGRDVFELACAELAQNRPHRAIELLMHEVAREASARGRLVRQTQIAYLMVEAGLDAVAQPILQRVIETIDERNLEQWESGPLVAQPLALMCRVLDRTGGDEETRQELYLRVCRLDPLQALALRAR